MGLNAAEGAKIKLQRPAGPQMFNNFPTVTKFNGSQARIEAQVFLIPKFVLFPLHYAHNNKN